MVWENNPSTSVSKPVALSGRLSYQGLPSYKTEALPCNLSMYFEIIIFITEVVLLFLLWPSSDFLNEVVCFGSTWWRSWLRHCATRRKVACSIPDGIFGIFQWHYPMAQRVTASNTNDTRNIFWEIKAAVRRLFWNLKTLGSVQAWNGIALPWLCFGIKLFFVYSAKPYIVCFNI
jgi:hypothetical protein